MTESPIIRHLRRARGLSAQALADRLGTTHQHIYNLERGRTKMTRDWAERLAAALDVHPVVIMWPELPHPHGAPVIGEARAGAWLEAERDPLHGDLQTAMLTASEHVPAPPHPRWPHAAQVAIRITDDHASPDLPPGSIAIVIPAAHAPDILDGLSRDALVVARRHRDDLTETTIRPIGTLTNDHELWGAVVWTVCKT